MAKSRRRIFQIVSLVIGGIIGAGFASGREIVSFFGEYGLFSFVFIALACLLIGFLVYIYCQVGNILDVSSLTDLTKIIFKKHNKLLNILFIAAMFITMGGMVAGVDALGGSVISGYASSPVPYLSIISILLLIIVVSGGIKSILKADEYLAPLLIGGFILVAASYLIFNGNNVSLSESSFWQSNPFSYIKGTFSAILYASMNLIAVGVMVVKVQSDATKKQSKRAAVISLVIVSVCMGLAMLAFLKSYVSGYDMPMIELAQQTSPILGGLYAIVIWMGIFTTLLASAFNLNNWFIKTFKTDRTFGIIVLSLLAFAFSRIGFSSIVGIFYPIEGAVGLVLIIGVYIYYRKNKKLIEAENKRAENSQKS